MLSEEKGLPMSPSTNLGSKARFNYISLFSNLPKIYNERNI
jgi:hypothetical protein